MVIRDSLILKAREVFIDTAKKQAIVLDTNLIRIFSYSTKEYEEPVSIGAKKPFVPLRPAPGLKWEWAREGLRVTGKATADIRVTGLYSVLGGAVAMPEQVGEGQWLIPKPASRGIHLLRFVSEGIPLSEKVAAP
jgi:hypothetical protein